MIERFSARTPTTRAHAERGWRAAAHVLVATALAAATLAGLAPAPPAAAADLCASQPPTSVTSASVTEYPQEVGEASAYKVTFTTSSTGALVGGQSKIFLENSSGPGLTFPAGSNHYTVNGVSVNVNGISGDGTLGPLTITVPATINPPGGVSVAMTDVINPSGSGSLEVCTSTDNAPTALSYTITADTSVGSPRVTPSREQAGTTATYTVSFTATSGLKSSQDEADTIMLATPQGQSPPQFPSNPNDYTVQDMSTSGSSATAVTTLPPGGSTGSVSIPVPSPVTANPGDTVAVVITDVTNPSVVSSDLLNVSTTADAKLGNPASYTITADTSVASASVSLDPSAANSMSTWTVGFTTSPRGALYGGETIILGSPSDPERWPPASDYTLTGVNPAPPLTPSCQSSGGSTTFPCQGEVILTLPPGTSQIIQANQAVTVTVAGVQNPAVTGSYTLDVSTSADKSPAAPSYSLTAATSVTGLAVSASPGSAGANPAQWTISFATSALAPSSGCSPACTADGALEPGSMITLKELDAGSTTTGTAQFPAARADYTVQGTAVIATPSGGGTNSVTITVPSGVTVKAGGTVKVMVTSVQNPTTQGANTVQVVTSADTSAASATFTLTASTVTGPGPGGTPAMTANMTPTAGASTDWKLGLMLSAGGALQSGSTINLSSAGATFSNTGTYTLTDSAGSSATLTGPATSGAQATLTLPSSSPSFPKDDVVTLTTTGSAVTNPGTGSHTFQISTSSDVAQVTSFPFTIGTASTANKPMASPTSATAGSPVTLSATVVPASCGSGSSCTAAAPTGTATFVEENQGQTLGQPATLVAGSGGTSTATTTVTFPVGTPSPVSIAAYYTPDSASTYASSVSQDLSLPVKSPPGAPTIGTAVAGNGSATVTWDAPSGTVTSYTVTPAPACSACTGLSVSGSPPGTSTTVTGLTNGTPYTFTVTATNSVGTGPASSASNVVVPTAATLENVNNGSATVNNGKTSSATGTAVAQSTDSSTSQSVEVTATGGSTTVTVGQWSADPTLPPTFNPAGYFAVSEVPTTPANGQAQSPSTVAVEICGYASARGLEWWNASAPAPAGSSAAGAWQPVSPAATTPASSSSTSSCSSGLTASLSGSSAPTLARLETASDPNPPATPNAPANTASGCDCVDFAVVGPPTAPVRLGGTDRIDTAVLVSRSSFPNAGSAQAVVVARSDTYPDALAGTPLAAANDAPLLLTQTSGLDPETKAEIERVLSPGGTVYLLGGDAALSTSVDSELKAAGYVTKRLEGATRFETAVAIAGALGDPKTILLATGVNFPDALAGGAAAAAVKGAVLLTNGSSQAPATEAYLKAHPGDTVDALGGPAAAADPSAKAIAGADRYDTAAKAAAAFFQAPATAGIASGANFPDALSGGANIAKLGGPMLLTDPGTLSSPTQAWLSSNRTGLASSLIYGGTVAVSASVADAVQAAISGS